MVKCKKCARCTKMEITSIQDEDGITIEEWWCYCSICENWMDEEDDMPCPGYIEAPNRV